MRKIISVVLSFGLLFQQSGLLYAAGELNLANYLSQARNAIVQPDIFQPARLRYISYDSQNNDFRLLLDKGNIVGNGLEPFPTQQEEAKLFNYFLIGLALPNDTFWVNLRPDAADNIIDPLLEKTDIGKIFLEADLQLKKDTASLTSPQNPEGKAYWDKLYKKAGELFGTENITIPTITRPWIVPNEVIVRETEDSAYIYKATLKVMLESDYLIGRGGSRTAPTPDQYAFSDPRLKELNEYSTQLIRETIIPKLTKEVNSSKRYAQLRQVYYSLVLARWFKQKYSSLGSTRAQGTSAPANSYLSLIDSGNLANLASKESYDKQTYFQAYQKSFKDGEYNLKETVATPFGQSIRSYISGGVSVGSPIKPGSFNAQEKNAEVTKALTGVVGSPLTLSQSQKLVVATIQIIRDSFSSEATKKRCSEIIDNVNSAKNLEGVIEAIDVLLEEGAYFTNSESDEIEKAVLMDLDHWGGISETLVVMRNSLEATLKKGKDYTASPVGKELGISDIYGRKLQYIAYWKLSQREKGNFSEAFKKLPQPSIENYFSAYLRYAVAVDSEGSIVSIVGWVNYDPDARSIKNIAVLQGINKKNQLRKELRKECEEELRTGEDFWKKKSVSGSPVLGESLYDGQDRIIPGLRFLSYADIKGNMKKSIMDGLKKTVFTSNNGGSLYYYTIDFSSLSGMYFAVELDGSGEIVELKGVLKIVDGKEEIGGKGNNKDIIDALEKKAKKIVSSAVVSGKVPKKLDKFGGIDLTDRALQIKLERVGSFASTPLLLPQVKNAQDLDLDKEFERIEALASSGIVPNSRRLLELFTACHYRGEFGQRLTQIISCLKASSAIQEAEAIDSDEDFRLALILPEMLS